MLKSAYVPASGSYTLGTLRRNRLLLSLVALQILCAIAVGFYLQLSFWGSTAPIILAVAVKLFYFMVANFLLFRLGYAIFVVKPKKPIHWMISDLRSILTDGVRVPDVVVTYLSMVGLIVTYTFLKDVIHALNPSLWDTQFAEWDRMLHGGYDVWDLLWPVLGYPYVTTAINFAYHAWFPLIYLAVCVACLDRRDPSRNMVFLVAFVLCWFVGGNVVATIFASVGPVYFEPFGLGDTYLPQMELLRELNSISPVWALNVQQGLLDGYLNNGAIRGISAMPSMHVASTVAVTLYGFSYSRWLGWGLTAFTAVIILGSVHLAWHYAVDGYASVLLAVFFWWLAKKLTARFGPAT